MRIVYDLIYKYEDFYLVKYKGIFSKQDFIELVVFGDSDYIFFDVDHFKSFYVNKDLNYWHIEHKYIQVINHV